MPPERDQLQNIPLRTDIGRALRDAFRARSGQAFLNVDFAEAEMRVQDLKWEHRDPCGCVFIDGVFHECPPCAKAAK